MQICHLPGIMQICTVSSGSARYRAELPGIMQTCPAAVYAFTNNQPAILNESERRSATERARFPASDTSTCYDAKDEFSIVRAVRKCIYGSRAEIKPDTGLR